MTDESHTVYRNYHKKNKFTKCSENIEPNYWNNCKYHDTYEINNVLNKYSKKKYHPKKLKLEYERIQKKYERVCDQYKILENENLRLKSEIDSYLGPKNEPKTEEQEDKWWKENEVYLQKAELESYVKWVKDLNEENDNLKRQIKYMNFKNNLLQKKVNFRNGVFKMIEKCINGDIDVKHPDYSNIDKNELDMLNDRGEDQYMSASKREMTLTEKCMEKARIKKIERESQKKLDENKNNDNKSDQNNIKLDIHSISDTKENDHSKINDEKTNETVGRNVNEIDPKPKKNSVFTDYVDNSDYTEDNFNPYNPSFKTVFGVRDEHIFRNCCLKLLYGKIPSYGVWEQLEEFDLSYWDSFDENQSYMIVDSVWRNYHSNYPDLKNKIERLLDNIPKNISDKNTTYNFILKDLVSWLFMKQ